jgi:hypothetical protein
VRTVDRGTPVGPPPEPGTVPRLDVLTHRLQQLRDWAGLSLRDLPGQVQALRLTRGIPDEPGVRPSYGAVQALFQTDRKRLNEGLLLDVVRVLLDCQAQPAAWREGQVALWRNAYRTIVKQSIREVRSRSFALGPLYTPCQILEGDGETTIDEQNVRVVVNPVNVRLPAELNLWREMIIADQLRRRQLGHEYIWNGPRYAVEDFFASRVGPLESPEVTLRLKHSDYYTFIAAQRLDDPFRNGATLRSLYLDGPRPP